MRRTQRRGLAAVDVIVLIGIIVLILGALLSGVLSVIWPGIKTGTHVRQCATNLKDIYKGFVLYSNADPRAPFPATLRARPNPGGPNVVWGTGAEANGDPFSPQIASTEIRPESSNKLSANDASAALFWLLRAQDLDPKTFVCPATTGEPDTFGGATKKQTVNFGRGRKEEKVGDRATSVMTYSIQNPYAMFSGFTWRFGAFAFEFALLSDLAPSVASRGTANGNSLNHLGAGQMWLGGDGHVEFSTTPNTGVQGDNIFLARNDTAASPILGPAVDSTDTTLAIMGDRGPQVPVTGALIIAAIALVGALGLAALFILRLVSKNRPGSPPPPPVMA